jgi:hypothetical protein
MLLCVTIDRIALEEDMRMDGAAAPWFEFPMVSAIFAFTNAYFLVIGRWVRNLEE